MARNQPDPQNCLRVDRRRFLMLSAVGGSSLVLGVLPEGARAAGDADANGEVLQPVAWIEIHPDNRIIFHMSKSEMGQGSSTGLAMLVAEELHVGLDQLDMVQAPYNPRYGNQSTGGSSSIRGSWQPLREAAAVTRELLLAAAAKTWQVPQAQCRAERAAVRHAGSGKTLRYGELVAVARQLPLPTRVALKKDGFTLIGTSPPRLDLPSKTDGSAIYGTDIKLDGMLAATVIHCPYFGGKLHQLDASAALALSGVHQVFSISTGVAIVADNHWLTEQARQRLKLEWRPSPGVSPVPVAHYRKLLEQPGIIVAKHGSQPALAGTRRVEAMYELPYQAHATMEPMCCTAHVHDGKVEVWAPTQSPAQAYSQAEQYGRSSLQRLTDKVLGKVFDKANDDVRIEVTQLGGGFGRRLQQDYVAEAVQIARRVQRPIRLMWSREEDMKHDYYRPATTHRLRAQLGPAGAIASWEHKLVGGSISEYLWPGSTGKGGDGAVTEGATKLPYAMRHLQVEYVKLKSVVPLGFWRSVGHSHNAFVKECFIDELAHAAGQDPLAYRIQLLQQQSELLAVLRLAADKAGWGQPLPDGHFHGLAMHSCFGSHAAQVAEVSVEHGRIRVHRVTCALDCGIAVDPDAVRAQVESAVAFGLTATLKSAISVEQGKVVQSNFNDFPLLRMSEMPEVTTHLVANPRSPGGVGEPGVPPIAPAVANAVFAATGQRLRRLPLRLPG
jgi:isoquinoline 1-oxidoreductase subunit beta